VSRPRILPCKGCEDGLAKLGPSQLYVSRRWPGGARGVFTYRCAAHRHTDLNAITLADFNRLPEVSLADLEGAGHDTEALLADFTQGAYPEEVARDLFDAGLAPGHARDLLAAGVDAGELAKASR